MNKRILTSLAVIFAVATIATGATVSYFSSTASVTNNTFATGILEIRVNGSSSTSGFNYTNAAPGDCATKVVTLSNYGAPWFAGPSILPAKEIWVGTANQSGDVNLYNALVGKVYVNAGWSGCSNPRVQFVAGKGCKAYEGSLGSMDADILYATQWGTHPSLVPGNSFTMTLEACLPNSGDQNALQGLSTMFDFVFNAYNPTRP